MAVLPVLNRLPSRTYAPCRNEGGKGSCTYRTLLDGTAGCRTGWVQRPNPNTEGASPSKVQEQRSRPGLSQNKTGCSCNLQTPNKPLDAVRVVKRTELVQHEPVVCQLQRPTGPEDRSNRLRRPHTQTRDHCVSFLLVPLRARASRRSSLLFGGTHTRLVPHCTPAGRARTTSATPTHLETS